jgi:phage terminase Nu1 subunit (DNA packaging protein)
MELCHKWGIPHSQFRGHGDGTWSDLDRRKALAYAHHAKQACPSCGTRADEWDEQSGGDEDAYRAITHRCIGCQLIADKQKHVPDGDEGHGVKVLLIPASIHAAMQLQHDTHQ